MKQKEPLIILDDITKSFFGNTVLEGVTIHINHGEIVTLLGPSGCGKTTLLRLISGFEKPDSGTIYLGGKNVTALPPEERSVNTVFQNYALFPHMSVFDNVAFGLRMQRIDAASVHTRVQDILRMVRLEHLADRKPSLLSGGQQQRVALARAVVNEPLVLLLDEPFSALDYKLRCQMQREMKAIQRKLDITFVFVTHDQEEAFAMSDRVLVMDSGCVVQEGTPQSIYEEPSNLYVARFVGEINIFPGIIETIGEDNFYNVRIYEEVFSIVSTKKYAVGERVNVLVRPEDLRIYHVYEERPSGPVLTAVVEDTVYKGATVTIHVQLENSKVSYEGEEFFDEDGLDISYALGERVYVTWVSGWEVVLPHEDA